MEKILFASDLDNTLIHSLRHQLPGDCCIEWIGDAEQTYMTPRAVALLRQLTGKVQLIPVTTRSIAQYLRIQWPAGTTPEYAVACNGAILLRGGEIDEAWYNQSKEMVAPYLPLLEQLYQALHDQIRFKSCRIIDGMYLYVHCHTAGEAQSCADTYSGKTALHVLCVGRKVYFLPPEFSKGAALRRLAERFGAEQTIAAGDSVVDISMLEAADCAIAPEGLLDAQDDNAVHVCPPEVHFSEFVLDTVLQYT